MFFDEQKLETKHPVEGATLKAVWGESTMLTFFEFNPRAVIPTHSHPHEQISYVIKGALEFTLDGETRILKAGQGAVVPPETEHGAKVLDEPTRVVDGWHPVRDDYK